jgi:hypothetical protein
VTVKGYVDRVAVVADGQTVADHPRSYGRRAKVLDPLHYLVVLGRKPAALDHAPVYRDWHLPAAFAAFRRDLEARLGPAAGARHYIRVLQLLARHPTGVVERAIECSRARGDPDAAAVTAAAERLALDNPPSPGDIPLSPGRPTTSVPLPDLSRFDRLLPRSPEGDDARERPERDAAEGQPEAAEAADHAGRVGEAGP